MKLALKLAIRIRRALLHGAAWGALAIGPAHTVDARAAEQVVNVPLQDGASIAYLLTQADGSQ
ncbi:MAG TPA: hypothetical protein VNE00_28400, partial [Paraburkholderia sp.]|nr:hypothetical protein [Paraburkholderia sp.]